MLLKWLSISLGLCLALAGTSQAADPKAAPEKVPKRFDARAEKFAFQYAIYLTKPRQADLVEAIERERAEKHPFLARVDAWPADIRGPVIMVGAPSIGEYAPPDLEGLRYFGVGLSQDDAKAVSGAKHVTTLTFASRQADMRRVHIAAQALVADLAREFGGYAWDEETRQVFGAKAWSSRTFPKGDEPPDISRHITMHAYRDGELLRIITLGMWKFGLPDLVANAVAQDSASGVGDLINLVAQTLLERGELVDGAVHVDIPKVKSQTLRAHQSEQLEEGGTGRAVIPLRRAKAEEGDPDNLILELVFGGAGATPQLGQSAILAGLYGGEGEIVFVDHDNAALQSASTRAKKRLLELKPAISDGFSAHESLLVKAPFETSSGGEEWIWVEVVSWRGDRIEGLLANDPFDLPGLERGARVHVDPNRAFDYIYTSPEGEVEGDETTAIIVKIQKESRNTRR